MRLDWGSMKKLQRVLIANRGEIALRILRAARGLGIETVAVYSDPDAAAPHVRLADARLKLGGATAADTYLNQEKLLLAASQSGADAIHPGYGFFAENAQFAEATVAAGLTFIGPTPEVISLMADKEQARARAEQAGVPVVPGSDASTDTAQLASAAKEIGLPVMVKAVAGGSGRGMRVVHEEVDLESKIEEAMREAEAGFRNPNVLVEKYIERPRHIEVQVFADSQGTTVHVGERECSVQRRHQKLVEEAPAPYLDPTLATNIRQSAVKLAKAVGYRGAGTVEYLVDGGRSADAAFYFLEMNTRIQVEHPVTELVSGYDLVREQFRVADGQELSFSQKDVELEGHAIEFRVYAEDPQHDFRPATGELCYVGRPSGAGIREDSWVEAGSRLSPYYDALLSKLSVWGRDRDEAIARARVALDEFVIEGVPTTLGFHRWLVRNDDFLRGTIDVSWIARSYEGEQLAAKTVGPLVLPEQTAAS